MIREPVPCNGCTACCRGNVIMLMPDIDDIASYDHEIVTLPGAGTGPVIKRRPDGSCIYLGENGCTVHDRAPAVCKTFDCRRWFKSQTRQWRRMASKDPGTKAILNAGKARLHTLEKGE